VWSVPDHIKMYQIYVEFLLIYLSFIFSTNGDNVPPEDIMESIANTALGVSPDNQIAIAYIRHRDAKFNAVTFNGFQNGESILVDKTQGFIAAKPDWTTTATAAAAAAAAERAEHAEDAILTQLVHMLPATKVVDVYLFTLNSPCCRPSPTRVAAMDNYFECSPSSCAGLISKFINSNIKGKMYVSWEIPFVASEFNQNGAPVHFYKRYFFAIRQLLRAGAVLLLREPLRGGIQLQWFQKEMFACINKITMANPTVLRSEKYTLVNRITASCVVNAKDGLDGAENSFSNSNCWEQSWKASHVFKSFRIPNEQQKAWRELMACCKKTNKDVLDGNVILGPPLLPSENAEPVVSQNTNDLRIK